MRFRNQGQLILTNLLTNESYLLSEMASRVIGLVDGTKSIEDVRNQTRKSYLKPSQFSQKKFDDFYRVLFLAGIIEELQEALLIKRVSITQKSLKPSAARSNEIKVTKLEDIELEVAAGASVGSGCGTSASSSSSSSSTSGSVSASVASGPGCGCC